MDALTPWQTTLLAVYCGLVAVLGVYGFHRWFMLRLYLRRCGDRVEPAGRFAELPSPGLQPSFGDLRPGPWRRSLPT